MKRNRPPSSQTLATLACLASCSNEWRYGLEISRETGLKSGSLYPILARCSERGLVESQWLEPSKPGRPPRHAYRITSAGLLVLKDVTRPNPLGNLKEKTA
ncbi:MAG: PadR family transcriptional regulator [Pseudomonadota bacterium]